MAQWAVVIPGKQYEAERLYHHDTLEVAGELSEPGPPAESGPPSSFRPAPGDEVLIVAERPERAVVALGRVAGGDGVSAPLVVAYTRRCFDDPRPAGDLVLGGVLSPVDPTAYRAVAARVADTVEARTWLVSVSLPIEADSPADAVRRFWSYVRELGPRELPAFVSPSGDELAMQVFVLGEQANLDPEEDGD